MIPYTNDIFNMNMGKVGIICKLYTTEWLYRKMIMIHVLQAWRDCPSSILIFMREGQQDIQALIQVKKEWLCLFITGHKS